VNRRLVIAGVASATLAGAVVPAFAQTGPSSPVTVYTDTHDGVSAGFFVNGQPGAGAHVSPDGEACVGISLQLPVCAGGGIGTVIDPPGTTTTRQELPLPPVVVYQDDNGTTVGVGNVGVRVGKDGRVCPLVSTQTWMCVGGEG
jgi:hypothetical protein